MGSHYARNGLNGTESIRQERNQGIYSNARANKAGSFDNVSYLTSTRHKEDQTKRKEYSQFDIERQEKSFEFNGKPPMQNNFFMEESKEDSRRDRNDANRTQSTSPLVSRNKSQTNFIYESPNTRKNYQKKELAIVSEFDYKPEKRNPNEKNSAYIDLPKKSPIAAQTQQSPIRTARRVNKDDIYPPTSPLNVKIPSSGKGSSSKNDAQPNLHEEIQKQNFAANWKEEEDLRAVMHLVKNKPKIATFFGLKQAIEEELKILKGAFLGETLEDCIKEAVEEKNNMALFLKAFLGPEALSQIKKSKKIVESIDKAQMEMDEIGKNISYIKSQGIGFLKALKQFVSSKKEATQIVRSKEAELVSQLDKFKKENKELNMEDSDLKEECKKYQKELERLRMQINSDKNTGRKGVPSSREKTQEQISMEKE
jgi:hypothetical protein